MVKIAIANSASDSAASKASEEFSANSSMPGLFLQQGNAMDHSTGFGGGASRIHLADFQHYRYFRSINQEHFAETKMEIMSIEFTPDLFSSVKTDQDTEG